MFRGRGRLIIVGCLLVVALAGSVYYLVFVVKPSTPTPEANNQFVQAVTRLQQQPVPDDPIQKAIFYAQFAQNFDGYGNKKDALDYFLKAQRVIDENNLGDQIVYYQAIADEYQSLGDTQNARVYMQLQLQHLQAYAQAHPDDPGTKDAIDTATKRLNSL